MPVVWCTIGFEEGGAADRSPMIVVGLTGSIGMGKSTTLRMFADEGIPVTDADTIVHRLYEGRAVPPVEAAFPGVVHHGSVDRKMLSERVIGDPAALRKLESIVHPLVREEEAAFVEEHRGAGDPLVLIDVPLLFEAGREGSFDKIVVVSCGSDVQRRRVLARPGMTEAKFEAILRRQLPDSQKRERADFVVKTDAGIDDARRQVHAIVGELRAMTRAGSET